MLTVDLTFEQLKTAMVANGINANAISLVNNKVVLDIGAVLGSSVNSLTNAGVVKFITKLLEYCIDAQTAINEQKQLGEKLASFSIQTYSTPANGSLPVTHSVTAHYQLNSTTRIVGVAE